MIWCGDLNVAHTELGVIPKANANGNHGFTRRNARGSRPLLKPGSWTRSASSRRAATTRGWSPMSGARARNVGWRIDYFLMSAALRPRLRRAFIAPDVTGSDHCPVGLELEATRH